MLYDAIVFDIDGTLWNTVSACTEAWNQTLKVLNVKYKITQEQIKSVMGTPQDTGVKQLLPKLYEKQPYLVEQLNKAEEKSIQEQGGTFYPGVQKGIRELSQNTPIFCVSNCETWYLNVFLDHSGLSQSITDASCYGHNKQTKTEMLKGLKAKHAFKYGVYLGDTLHDQQAAAEAELEFIFAAYGFGKVENAELSFDSSQELMEHLGKLQNVQKHL